MNAALHRLARKAAARIKGKRIVLIGGAPATGKSTLAAKIAQRFSLPWISTDQMRRIMRTVANRADHPKLFKPEGYDAQRFLNQFSAQQIVDMQFEEGEAVWSGARPFIKENWLWTDGFIVEGLHILPHLVARDCKDDKCVRAIFLVDEDAGRMRSAIYSRGLWGDAREYPDSVKEKEVEWAILFGRRLRAEAHRFGFQCVEVTKSAGDLRTVLAALESRPGPGSQRSLG